MEALPEELQSTINAEGLTLQDLVFLTPDEIHELTSCLNERTQLLDLIDKYKKCQNSGGMSSHTAVYENDSEASRNQSSTTSTESTSRLVCPLCPYQLTCKLNMKLSSYLRHIQDYHAHQPSFRVTCGMYGCPRTFTKFSTFRTHIYERHGGDSMVTNQIHLANQVASGALLQTDMEIDQGAAMFTSADEIISESILNGNDPVVDFSRESSDAVKTRLHNSAALVLLGLKEKHKLTQVATQGIIEDTTGLIQVYMRALHQQLVQNGVDHQCLSEIFDEQSLFLDPFKEVKTPSQQLKYYRKQFGMIEPIRIKLGENLAWKGAGHTRQCVVKVDELMYVPLLKTLEQVLQDENNIAEIEKGHCSTSDYMFDYCDGTQFKHHPLFSIHPDALQIFFYFDDLEACNPLGSKTKKHKLSMFYFTVGNLPPASRSQLSAIYLLAVCKHKLLRKYGMDAILKPFIEDVKKLELGYTFNVRGANRTFFGTIALVSADNLGSLALGGFKESCSSNRMCRHCMATRAASKTKFKEKDFKLRTPAAHKRHCRKLQESSTASTKYGINRDSILNDLRYFHVCGGGLLPDIMHDVLEGVLQLEVKLMLQKLIFEDNQFTLDTFNSQLENFELGYMESKDRPTPLTAKTIKSNGHSLKQEAAQMWLLGRILPLLIGDLVPDDNELWINFLLLMEIVDLLFSTKLTEDQAAYLAVKITDHHEEFMRLYGNENAIPKIHFMLHMARLILEFGPLVCYWTMRYEAKHSYFKSLTVAIGNFINLPFTLAMRHQEQQCYLANSTRPNHMTLGRVCEVCPEELEGIVDNQTSTFETKSVTIEGRTYKTGAAIVQSEDKILIIKNIFINNDKIWFKGNTMFISKYHSHFRAYELGTVGTDSLISYSSLNNKLPFHPRKCRGLPTSTVILLPFTILQ